RRAGRDGNGAGAEPAAQRVAEAVRGIGREHEGAVPVRGGAERSGEREARLADAALAGEQEDAHQTASGGAKSTVSVPALSRARASASGTTCRGSGSERRWPPVAITSSPSSFTTSRSSARASGSGSVARTPALVRTKRSPRSRHRTASGAYPAKSASPWRARAGTPITSSGAGLAVGPGRRARRAAR